MKAQSSFHADSDFFALYESLKKEGKWREIIRNGVAALETKKLNNEQASLVNCRMASCYFYLGDHEAALKAATHASEQAQLAGHHGLIARSLYLISAAYRALAQKGTNPAHSQLALENIDIAILTLGNHDVGKSIQAKVYYNAGALHHDVFNNIENADTYYKMAMALFEKGSDDFNRTMLRHIRCLIELNKLAEAEIEATKLDIPLDTKTGVHFMIMMAKLNMKGKKYPEARHFLENAKKVAEEKSMGQEVQMLTDLSEAIKAEITVDQEVLMVKASHLEL